MSLSKPPWSHFGPHHPFPDKQRFHTFYRDAPSFLPPLGFSISTVLAPPPPASSNMSNSANMNALSQAEMERFQKLSNEFEPDVQVSLKRHQSFRHGQKIADFVDRDRLYRTSNRVIKLRWIMPMRIQLLQQRQTYVVTLSILPYHFYRC